MKHSLALALVTTLSLSLLASRSREDGEWLAEALQVPLVGAGPLDALDGKERERLADAVGAASGDIALWEALTEDDRVLLVARSEVSGGAGPERPERTVLFARAEGPAYTAAAVLDADGRPLAEWTHFLESFEHYDLPRVKTAVPRAHLETTRAKLAASDDADERVTWALLETLRAMNQQAAPFNLPPSSGRDTPAETRAMADAYERLAELSRDLAPLLGEQRARFEELALDSADSARALQTALETEDAELANEVRGRILANCRACHDLELPAHDGKVKEVFYDERHERGVGDGFYELGHDVRYRHADYERAQRVADALREAALAIDVAAER